MNKYGLTIALIMTAMLLPACSSTPHRYQEPAADKKQAGDIDFDPLALTEDRDIVPQTHPVKPALVLPGEANDSLINPGPGGFGGADSTQMTEPEEVFRVQIFTSRLFNEARRELAIAEEIFNLPVHLDYEVPYYKLRVGDFATRDEAEAMVSEIRGIGYRSAWVARVNMQIEPEPEFTTPDNPYLQIDSTQFVPDSLETVITEPEEESD